MLLMTLIVSIRPQDRVVLPAGPQDEGNRGTDRATLVKVLLHANWCRQVPAEHALPLSMSTVLA